MLFCIFTQQDFGLWVNLGNVFNLDSRHYLTFFNSVDFIYKYGFGRWETYIQTTSSRPRKVSEKYFNKLILQYILIFKLYYHVQGILGRENWKHLKAHTDKITFVFNVRSVFQFTMPISCSFTTDTQRLFFNVFIFNWRIIVL